ncbi:MAG: DNA/RNA nuclease SfsA, partial [Fusobacteriaceae bacterium]
MRRKLIYEIGNTTEGIFLERPNRFIAMVKISGGEIVTVHVHDSGRLRELLFEGNKVVIRKAADLSKRTTEWDMISAMKDGEQVLINSSFHRKLTDILFRDNEISPFKNLLHIKAEIKYGASRLDYLLEDSNGKIYVETKGVSLAEDGVAKFPDAPSIRAT